MEQVIVTNKSESTEHRVKTFFQKKDVLEVFLSLVQILLFAEMVRNLTYGIESMYQIERDIYFFRASSCFCVELFILRKNKLYKFPFLLVILGYGLYYGKTMLGYTVELYGEVAVEWKSTILFAQGLFLLLLVDILISWKEYSIKFYNKWYGIFTLVMLTFILALNFECSRPIIFPLITLFLTPMTEKEWKRFAGWLAIGYYLAFLWIYTRSLIQVPPIEENRYGRLYLGTFFNYSTEGAFCAGTFLCAFYWFLIWAGKKNRWGMGLGILSMLYPFVALLLCGERSSLFPVVIILVLSYFCLNLKKEGKKQKQRNIIFVCVIISLILLLAVLLLILGRINEEELIELENTLNTVFSKRITDYILLIIDRGKQLYRFDSKYGFFPDGSILNPLDWLTTGRVSHWADSILRTTWFGSSDVTVFVGYLRYHPHSAYFTWLRFYGWIGGSVMIAWFITTIIVASRRLINRDKRVLSTFLWSHFLALFGIGEMVLWTYPVGFCFLIMLYPVLIRFQDPGEGEFNE